MRPPHTPTEPEHQGPSPGPTDLGFRSQHSHVTTPRPPSPPTSMIMLSFVLQARPGALGAPAMAELQWGPRGWERTRVGAAPPALTAPSRSLCRRLGAVLALCTSHICWGCGCQPRECLLAPSVTTRGRSDITQRDDRATSIEKSFGAEDTGKGGARTQTGASSSHPAPPQARPFAPCQGQRQGKEGRPVGAPGTPGTVDQPVPEAGWPGTPRRGSLLLTLPLPTTCTWGGPGR